MSDIWNQIRLLIVSGSNININKNNLQTIPKGSGSNTGIIDSIVNYWHSLTLRKQRLLILQSSIVFSVVYYILSPSITSQPPMFSKRPDKYTTGFINLRNDCFANSSLQAYSSLPGLTDYLNKFINNFQKLNQFIIDNKINIHQVIEDKLTIYKESNKKDHHSESSSKFKNSNTKFSIPLHFALAEIIKKLQETQLSSRTISVWTFLHCLESIFNAKISRSQHDAHELTQLINETLENENLKIMKLLSFIIKHLHKYINNPNPHEYDLLQSIIIPEFPFGGLLLSQFQCAKCNGVSTPKFSPFTMITIHAPEKLSCELDTLIEQNESETIDGYNCLKCRIDAIVQNEKLLNRTITDEDELNHINEIKKIFGENFKTFCINEDLPTLLETYINQYQTQTLNGFQISQITSTVIKKTQILKPPRIFGIHLSRSSFNGVDITRNSCHVSFKDNLNLSIGKEYRDRLKDFQDSINNQEQVEFNEIKSTNVLTHDLNDVEDEDVQREDIDEKGNEENEEDEEEEEEVDDVDADSNTSSTDEIPEGDEDKEDDSNPSSRGTSVGSKTSQTTIPHSSSTTATSADSTSKTINNAPISTAQEDDLRDHFKKFKFNDNDIYKYKLKAMIRHQGSHTQGHYECYKRKPLYAKDKDGNIFKLTPEINIDDDYDLTANGGDGDENSSTLMNNTTSIKTTGSTPMKRRLSSIMGSKPSIIYQTNTEESNIEEIINSGLATPAEFLVHESVNHIDAAFASSLTEDAFNKKQSDQASSKVKMKKIPSIIKNPYWRISDSNVIEVSKRQVLVETSSVYMIYYERVERKQIKSRHHS
ncbi:hypothetical protein DFJ63DRAFT_316702 [Scheffersomyces coipomensis]|uniref:uncharacterized protein n=1 Tax=Scheffersomyces coipomensis TaxID=1788519 RepID=UPI00315CB8D5